MHREPDHFMMVDALSWYLLKETTLPLDPEKGMQDITTEQSSILFEEHNKFDYFSFTFPWTVEHPRLGKVVIATISDIQETLDGIDDYTEWMAVKDEGKDVPPANGHADIF